MADDRDAVRVEGLRELISNVRKVDQRFPKELRAINLQVVEPVAAQAASRAPVGLTGRLQASVRALASQRAGQIAAGRAALPYAGVVHYGWPARNITGNPFLTSALYSEKSDALETYERLMGEFIDRVWVDTAF